MVMIMAEQTSIKEVIAFPKNTAACSPMDDSPFNRWCKSIRRFTYKKLFFPEKKED